MSVRLLSGIQQGLLWARTTIFVCVCARGPGVRQDKIGETKLHLLGGFRRRENTLVADGCVCRMVVVSEESALGGGLGQAHVRWTREPLTHVQEGHNCKAGRHIPATWLVACIHPQISHKISNVRAHTHTHTLFMSHQIYSVWPALADSSKTQPNRMGPDG
jgi:hypothetical protein